MATYSGDVRGDVTVRAGDDVSKLTSVDGSLYIEAEGAQLPVLTSVGGFLYISAEGAQLPALTSVGGSLYIEAEGAQLPALTSVGGSLSISAEGAQLPVLTSVGGSLYISAEGAQLPVLTSVGGFLYIEAEGAQLPALTSVDGSLNISAEGAQLPVLTSVGGYDLPDDETARARLIDVAKAALADSANLVMDKWHNESGRCGTSHCIAGWAVHLAGDDGYDLEEKVNQPAAGNILLGVQASALFFLNTDQARSKLIEVLRDAGEPLPGEASA